MTDLLASLEASAFSTFVRESPSVWAYPTILTLHTIGLGVLVGANWMLDLRVLGYARAIPLSAISRAFPAMWIGFWLNAVTGVALFVADPAKGATNLFAAKLAMVACGVALMIALKRRLYGRNPDADASAGLKTIAVVPLAIWIAAIGAGRWMAYI